MRFLSPNDEAIETRLLFVTLVALNEDLREMKGQRLQRQRIHRRMDNGKGKRKGNGKGKRKDKGKGKTEHDKKGEEGRTVRVSTLMNLAKSRAIAGESVSRSLGVKTTSLSAFKLEHSLSIK